MVPGIYGHGTPPGPKVQALLDAAASLSEAPPAYPEEDSVRVFLVCLQMATYHINMNFICPNSIGHISWPNTTFTSATLNLPDTSICFFIYRYIRYVTIFTTLAKWYYLVG